MARSHPNELVGVVVPLTASSLENWKMCRRYYRSRHLLSLPSSDPGLDTNVGLAVHNVLRAVHLEECCGDETATTELLQRLAPEESSVLSGYLRRHATQCPKNATWSDHEFELARFKRSNLGMWMLTGKIDAAWERKGLPGGDFLDARDYKTGRVWYERVADDLAARVQAYLLAPIAAQRGLNVRISYEHLDESVTENPEPYEPEPEDFAEIEQELTMLASEIARETKFVGVREARVCTGCNYSSICPDAVLSPQPA